MLNLNRSKRDLFDRRRSLGNENQNSMPILSFNDHYRGIQPNCENVTNNQSKSTKRAELLSQLPASTKVSSVRTMKPTKIFQTQDTTHQYNLLTSFQNSYASLMGNTEPKAFLDNSMVNNLSSQVLYISVRRLCDLVQTVYIHHLS